MLRKEKRTLELYKQAGARAKLSEKIFYGDSENSPNFHVFLKAHDIDVLNNLEARYRVLVGNADEQLYKDYGKENVNGLNDIFFGNSITGEPLSDTDVDIMKIAAEICFGIYSEITKKLRAYEGTYHENNCQQ